MAINYPVSLDTLTNPSATDPTTSPSHATQHANANDAIEALQAKVGADSSAVTTSHDYKLSAVTGTDKAVGVSATQTLTNKTLTAPTIGDFTNANHTHQGSTSGAKLDHGAALNGLTDDDHTQYALLAGRSGGQVLIGGTGAGDDLTFQTTSNGSKGSYIFSEMSVAGYLKNDANGVVTGGNSIAAGDLPSAIDAAKIADGSVENAEFQYLNGVTSAIQTQIDGKAATSHAHSAADITSGTLAVARGGTGVTTFGGTNTLLYTSAVDTLSSIATANNGVLITSAGGVPSISSTLPTAVQDNITRVGTITSGVWSGTDIAVADGGTGASSFTAYAVICGGTTSTAALQPIASVGTSGHVLTSNGAGALPSFQAPAAGTTSVYVHFTTIFSGTTTGFTSTVGGSATNSIGTYGLEMTLAASSGSNALFGRADTAGNNLLDFSIDSIFATQFYADNITNTTCVGAMVFGDVTVAAASITYTPEHYGFELAHPSAGQTDVYASNANGTTQTRTAMGAGNTRALTAIFDSGTNIKFYDLSTLDATHTTNLPTGPLGTYVFMIGASNKSTTNTCRYFVPFVDIAYFIV